MIALHRGHEYRRFRVSRARRASSFCRCPFSMTSATLSAKLSGSSAMRRPSSCETLMSPFATEVATTGTPQASASRILNCIPEPASIGQTDTAARLMYSDIESTKPTTRMALFASSSRLSLADGPPPTTQNRAPGTLVWTRGNTSLAKYRTAFSLGKYPMFPVKTMRGLISAFAGCG